MLTDSVEVVEIAAGTGWIRDDGPTFLIDDNGARRGVDWDFNGWGYAGQSRISKNFTSYFANDSSEAAQRPFGIRRIYRNRYTGEKQTHTCRRGPAIRLPAVNGSRWPGRAACSSMATFSPSNPPRSRFAA